MLYLQFIFKWSAKFSGHGLILPFSTNFENGKDRLEIFSCYRISRRRLYFCDIFYDFNVIARREPKTFIDEERSPKTLKSFWLNQSNNFYLFYLIFESKKNWWLHNFLDYFELEEKIDFNANFDEIFNEIKEKVF